MIFDGLQALAPQEFYNLSCCHSSLAGLAAQSGTGLTAGDGRAEAEQAMQALRPAIASGYRSVAYMREDPSLNPRRARTDFLLLIMDLEFPDDAFAS